MTDRETWQWQEPGSAWKGAGLYHITLTVGSRLPLLGSLVVPDDDPTKASVQRTALGDALVDCLLSIQSHHPEVKVLHFCLMPNHLHAVLYVQRRMTTGIGATVRGFWQASKKLGRASSVFANAIREKSEEKAPNPIRGKLQEDTDIDRINGELREESSRLRSEAASLRERLGDEAYYSLAPIFDEMPFIRPMARYSQLQNTIRYIDMNPQRLATKRLKPGFFRVQKDISIGNRSYDGVGNVGLLMQESYCPVHVRRAMVEKANGGDDKELRDYKNACVVKARQGAVMVSPFISPDEKEVMQVLLKEQSPFILLTNNGFRDYYKPTDILFDACAAGRLLILSPWSYDSGKRHISRSDCVALNAMAEEIANSLTGEV